MQFECLTGFDTIGSVKLDRLVSRHRFMGRTQALRLLAAGRISVNGSVARDGHREVDRFCAVSIDGDMIQTPQRALYLMVHKPVGVVSVTVDATHPTVIDLIDDPDRHCLHPAGRLDLNTSGLVLLTNDGRWSKRITEAASKVAKVYRVETQDPVTENDVSAFARGFHFHTEDITTLPAELERIGDRVARLTLHEGRYHQIKRMFWRTGNRVLKLHRESIGGITLPADLGPGEWRHLSMKEIERIP